MAFDTLGDLNWLAVLVAAIAYFVLGASWYIPPVFGTAWMRAAGTEMPEGQRPGPAIYLAPLITCLVASIATAMLAAATGSGTFSEGLVLGLVVGVGYAVTSAALGAIFDQKPEPALWFLITAGYHLLGLLIVAVIVSVWT